MSGKTALVSQTCEFISSLDNLLVSPSTITTVLSVAAFRDGVITKSDKSTYDALGATSRREVDAYTHEDNLNEARRTIKLLDEEFIGELMSTYRDLFF